MPSVARLTTTLRPHAINGDSRETHQQHMPHAVDDVVRGSADTLNNNYFFFVLAGGDGLPNKFSS
jgi:diacylglycerol kinase family enzyme